MHSFSLLQGTTWSEHYSSIYYRTIKEKRSNEGHHSKQWHNWRSKDLPLTHLLKPSYTHPKQPSICSVRAPGENKWKPDEPQQTEAINAWDRWEGITVPRVCWLLQWLTLHWTLAQWRKGAPLRLLWCLAFAMVIGMVIGRAPLTLNYRASQPFFHWNMWHRNTATSYWNTHWFKDHLFITWGSR